MRSSTIYLLVAFNNPAPMKNETLVSHESQCMVTFWSHWACYILSQARLIPGIRSAWSLIPSEQSNSFLLQQYNSALLWIGTNYTVAIKKITTAEYLWPHFGEYSQTMFFPKPGFMLNINLCLCGKYSGKGLKSYDTQSTSHIMWMEILTLQSTNSRLTTFAC
jgi:hypothetical protein